MVIAMIPALAPGNYQIKVVSQYASGKQLVSSKSYTFGKPLSVS